MKAPGFEKHRNDIPRGQSAERDWYSALRREWRCTKLSILLLPDKKMLTVESTTFTCDTCQRSFRRRKDIARYKCQTICPRGLPEEIQLAQSATLWQKGILLSRFKVCACVCVRDVTKMAVWMP